MNERIRSAADRALARARAQARWLGRPHIAQQRLLALFIAALVADFEAGGVEAIRQLRQFDPVNYLRLIALIVPKQLSDLAARNEDYEHDIDDAIDRVREIAEAYAEAIGNPEGAGTQEPPATLPALPQAI